MTTQRLEIVRSTDEVFIADSVLARYVPEFTMMGSSAPASPIPRVVALAARGNIIDKSAIVTLTRNYSTEKPNYQVTIVLSASDGNHKQLFVSGSNGSFGISDDNTEIYGRSSEINAADSFFEVIKLL
jgi:hypothetical protein